MFCLTSAHKINSHIFKIKIIWNNAYFFIDFVNRYNCTGLIKVKSNDIANNDEAVIKRVLLVNKQTSGLYKFLFGN